MTTLEQKEYQVKENIFEYLGKSYNCEFAINRDIRMILQEAKSHKGFDEIYDKTTLRPHKIRVFIDKNKTIIFGIIIYIIDYKNNYGGRYACGGYYPFGINNLLLPHPFQESICW